MTAPVFEYGFERDRLLPPGREHLVYRWWFYLDAHGDRLRNQQARLGVTDRGFRFARGGRASSEEEAKRLLSGAHAEAQQEIDYWRGQPSHALGERGELIPLDVVLPELPA